MQKKRKRPASKPARKAKHVAQAEAPASALAEVEAQLVSVRARLAEELTGSAHVKLLAELRGFLRLKTELERRDRLLRAELEERAALLEEAIAHHPKWVALCAELNAVIAPCPTCGLAVDALLAEKP